MPNNRNRNTGGKPTYTGRISNSGAQRVEAPVNAGSKSGKVVVKTGNDLRNGR